jgi:hypothetical protein
MTDIGLLAQDDRHSMQRKETLACRKATTASPDPRTTVLASRIMTLRLQRRLPLFDRNAPQGRPFEVRVDDLARARCAPSRDDEASVHASLLADAKG